MNKVAILNINQFNHADRNEFYANTIENHLVTAHKDIAHPHSHNFYLSVLFTHGSGLHEVDFNRFDVKPGAVFFLNPGQTHHWELSDDVKGYIFFHTQEFYDVHFRQQTIHHYPFFYSLHNSPCLYLDNVASKIITALFEQVIVENLTARTLKQQKILALVDLIYIEITRLYLENAQPAEISHNQYYSRFRQLEELIEANFARIKSPAEYAEMLHMSLKHLNRITQAVTGKSTGDLILERVLLEAKKLLVLPYNSVTDIAYSLGYNDYAYFSRLFKKKTGETPTEFIRKYRTGS